MKSETRARAVVHVYGREREREREPERERERERECERKRERERERERECERERSGRSRRSPSGPVNLTVRWNLPPLEENSSFYFFFFPSFPILAVDRKRCSVSAKYILLLLKFEDSVILIHRFII